MSFTLTFIIVVVLAAFLSPILRSVLVSLKTPDQLSETNAPFLPSLPQTFSFDGKDLRIKRVGDELVNRAGRGLLEPSLVYLDGRYFLTRHTAVGLVYWYDHYRCDDFAQGLCDLGGQCDRDST